jgi:hypothetical protein
MIHPELQKLLDYALQSGELTQNHKDLIFRKAQELGQDLVSLEMVIESELQKIKKQSAPEKQTNFSCPNCGSSIPKSSIKCGFCGFEVTKSNITGQNYIKQLEEAISKLDSEYASQEHRVINVWSGNVVGDPSGKILARKKADLISTFTMPNDKEHLLEFFHFCDTNADSYHQQSAIKAGFHTIIDHKIKPLADAWYGKANLAYSKLKRFANEDEQIKQLVDTYKNKYHVEAQDMKQAPILNNQPKNKGCLPFFVMILIVFTATYLLTKSSPV